jgi:ParB family transcriptional regulator, chromosome partitioning protein
LARKGSNSKASLAALIPDRDLQPADVGRVRQIPIEEIRPNRNQPRKTFAPKGLQDLVASIRANGIIQPLLAQQCEGGYELIAGERRYRAACMAGLLEVPTIVRTVEQEADALELALIENIQREDLNPIEEAEAYLKLQEQYGYTQEMLSRKLGRARATVANVLRLLNLPAEVQEAICDGVVSTGHGKVLLGLEDHDDIREVFAEVVSRALNVRQTEDAVRRFLNQPTTPPPAPEAPAYVRGLTERLGNYLSTRVTIAPRRGGGGRVVVEYNDDEDLGRIVETIEREF